MKIFKNQTIDEEFRRYGYVIVDLFSKEQVRELRAIYDRHPPPAELPFVSSMIYGDHDYASAVHNDIMDVVGSSVEDLMIDHRMFYASFAVKAPRVPLGSVGIHQDPTLVDEHEYTSFSTWCPLIEMRKDNGWLGVIGGSHHFNRGFRGPGPVYMDLHDMCNKKLVTYLPVRPGHVVFMHPRVLHCSSANQSDEQRLVVVSAIAPRACKQLYFCHRGFQEDRDKIEVFKVDEDFFLRHTFGIRPADVPLHKVVSSPPEPMDARRLTDTCGALVRKPSDRAIVEGFRASC